MAQAGTLPWDEVVATYGAKFMEGLAFLGTRRKHVNVLQYLMGYLKKEVSSEDKQELLALIEDYRQELLPLFVPLTLLQHHLRRHVVPPAPAEYRSQGGGGDRREGQGGWVWDAGADRRAFAAGPKELMLRNHV